MDSDQVVQAQLSRIEDKIDELSSRVTKLESTEKIYRLLFGSIGVFIGFMVKELIGRIV